ncbi:MAG: PH domain-containing protein [bacterium]|nr:PH domain-containing protein [bacterium]
MAEIITEKDFPLQKSWFGKKIISGVSYLIYIVIPIGLPFYVAHLKGNGQKFIEQMPMGIKIIQIMMIVFIVSLPFSAILRRIMFYFSLGEKYITLKQGIFSKSERHIPYGVIQNLFIKQSMFDRIFGLAFLSIEDASQGAGSGALPYGELVGFSGNKIGIPGIRKSDAEKLKEIILQKMKENPVEDSQSGL